MNYVFCIPGKLSRRRAEWKICIGKDGWLEGGDDYMIVTRLEFQSIHIEVQGSILYRALKFIL